MRFAQAQRPAALGGFRVAAEELDKERGERFDCAGECGWEEGTEHGVAFDVRVEGGGQGVATGCAAEGVVEVGGLGQRITSQLELPLYDASGSLLDSQAAMPPASSTRLVIPYCCRILAAIEER